MKKTLYFIAVLLLFVGCASIEPDDGRHFRPPTFHFTPYQPPKPVDLSTTSYTVFISGQTIKLGR